MKNFIILLVTSFFLVTTTTANPTINDEYQRYLNEQTEVVMKAYNENRDLLYAHMLGIIRKYENTEDAYDTTFEEFLIKENSLSLKKLTENEVFLESSLDMLNARYNNLEKLHSTENKTRQKLLVQTFSEKQDILKSELAELTKRYACISKSSKDEYLYFLDERTGTIWSTLVAQKTLLSFLNTPNVLMGNLLDNK